MKCTKRFPTLSTLCCKILGIAMKAIFPSIDLENRAIFPPWVSIAATLFRKVISASIQAMPCAIKVAQATPATPQWKEITNKRSSKIFPMDDPIKNTRGVLESPKDVNTPVATLYKNKKTRPAM